ncbi:hypothetical protein [Streptomyces sp. NPDC046759]|uniref:nucleotidyltransferase domain-containing protein n=1 Tax=Streptomyces sp. NPDC046759 TaxID=3155019 RepID=UPI0033F4B1D3
MDADDLGRWVPEHPEEVAAVFAKADFPWWIAGGYAIELAVGRELRPHDETNATGAPYLAPEVQFFYKAKATRDKDETDFEAALPLPGEEQRVKPCPRADHMGWARTRG